MDHISLKPDDTIRARQRIAKHIRTTPVMTSPEINDMLGLEAFFKCEHLQLTGSFKLRGAMHAVGLLDDGCTGVATHSSGNHGAALARAARQHGIEAHVVMPDNAVRSKIRAVQACGGQVHLCAANQHSRETGLMRLVEQGFEAIPPYDDDRIIAGQGSCALELLEQVPNLDAIVAPVGGGGLLAGTALAARTRPGPLKVIGVEPAGADDTIRSLRAGKRVHDHDPVTMADGLRALVGQRNLAIIARDIETVIAVSEEAILAAMELLWSQLKQVIEPSGAVALAGVMNQRQAMSRARVGIILSGGNLDVTAMLDRLAQ